MYSSLASHVNSGGGELEGMCHHSNALSCWRKPRSVKCPNSMLGSMTISLYPCVCEHVDLCPQAMLSAQQCLKLLTAFYLCLIVVTSSCAFLRKIKNSTKQTKQKNNSISLKHVINSRPVVNKKHKLGILLH